MTMFRRLLAVLMAFSLCWTTVACSSSTPRSTADNFSNNVSRSVNQVISGRYPVQQATYDDLDGTYTLMLLNATPPVFRTDNLQMARLTEEQLANGESPYLEVNGDSAVLYLTEDFKIEYVHSVTETQTNPQTGQPETVIVRQQSNFWTPFAGALAGQALGSLLFRPQYYVPPIYQPGVVLRGYGGYGHTYDSAVQRYQTKHNSAPPVVKNRQNLRTTGNIRRSGTSATRQPSRTSTKSTGSGYGTNQLKNSGNSRTKMRSKSSFGSRSPSRSSSRSFRGGRRR